MNAIIASTPTTPRAGLSAVEQAALRAADSAAVSPAGKRDLTLAIVMELRAAGLLTVPARRTDDTEYECPLCNRWARWTHGKRISTDGRGDEFWCQSCGATVFLAVCDRRPGTATLQAEIEQLKARVEELQKRLNDAAMTKVWRNEDGKKFVFVEDIAPALLGIEGSDR